MVGIAHEKKKKNMLRKDFYMEIAKTMNRFISIFLIVAMGVAFFFGYPASEPDMRYTADDHFGRAAAHGYTCSWNAGAYGR